MNEFDLSVRFAEVLAQTNQSFIDFGNTLRSMPQVLNVSTGMDCRKYTEKLVIEIYVEAELSNEAFVCWWLEISKGEDEWVISSSILLNADSVQETVKEFPCLSAGNIDELEAALQEQIHLSFLNFIFR